MRDVLSGVKSARKWRARFRAPSPSYRELAAAFLVAAVGATAAVWALSNFLGLLLGAAGLCVVAYVYRGRVRAAQFELEVGEEDIQWRRHGRLTRLAWPDVVRISRNSDGNEDTWVFWMREGQTVSVDYSVLSKADQDQAERCIWQRVASYQIRVE